MIKEDKFKAQLRLKDADEYIQSAKENLEKQRTKACLDHAIDAVIAANDAFTIFMIEEIASTDHREAIALHKEAGKKISENKSSDLALLLEERHRKSYRPVTVTSQLAEIDLNKAIKFVEWVRSKIK